MSSSQWSDTESATRLLSLQDFDLLDNWSTRVSLLFVESSQSKQNSIDMFASQMHGFISSSRTIGNSH